MKVFMQPAFEERFLKLSNAERGLFVTLYYWIYTSGSSIPSDPEECWKRVRYFAGISKTRFLKLFPAIAGSLEAIR